MAFLTWDKYHPEVAQACKNIQPWPCEKIATGLAGVSQPSIVKDPKGQLFVAGTHGEVFHSRDGAESWALLCEAPALDPDVPAGLKVMALDSSGIGVSSEGTLLLPWRMAYNDGREYCGHEDETYHDVMWVTRSEDRGKTWEASPLLDPSPYDVIGGNQVRINEMSDGRLLVVETAARQPRPGKPLPKSEWKLWALLFCSTDDGRTWTHIADLGEHTDESDLLELPSGKLLASVRYQRKKLPDDPDELATPYYFDPEHDKDRCRECREYGPTGVGGHSVYKQSAVVHSDDEGKTWSAPRIVTGWLQQTGCLARLSDGTVLLPFGHKDEGHGQRVIISFDEGETWSKAVYELNKFGMYASSVVLGDDTIVTVHDSAGTGDSRGLHVLRWKAPPREEVSKYGFFEPRPAQSPE